MSSLAELRQSYQRDTLDPADVPASPFDLFHAWFAEAQAAEAREPNAMTLATASAEGIPSARIVLIKGVDTGFVFYTNTDSRKGRELAATPHAALTFWWPELERQVRVEGTVEPVSVAEADAYFASRPLGSRIGAPLIAVLGGYLFSPDESSTKTIQAWNWNSATLLPSESSTQPFTTSIWPPPGRATMTLMGLPASTTSSYDRPPL